MKSPATYGNLKDLSHKKKELWDKAKKIVDGAEKENRAMNGEEKGQWEEIMKAVDEHGERISALERMADEESDEDEDREDEEEEDRDEEDDGDEEDETEEDDSDRKLPKYIIKGGKKYYLQKRKAGGRIVAPKSPRVEQMPGESKRHYEDRKRRSSVEYRNAFWNWFCHGADALQTREGRAIQADSDIVGGYLVAPQEFVASLIKFVNNYVFMRQKGTVYTLKQAQSLGAPSLDADPADSDWTSELDTGNEDSSMAFGKRELTPHPLAKRIKVSNRLLRMGQITSGVSADGSVVTGGVENLVRDRLGYKFGVTEEKAFLLGTGANQPLGVFTASSMGISTGRDVSSINSGSIVGDDLIACKYNQKVQYWPRLEWIFHRTILQKIRMLKDSYGQYLWVPGGFGGESDTLLDIPVNMSEYAPNTYTTGNYVGLLMDPSFYWIADSLTLEVQRLVELYAAANQTGFIARMELDGMPVLEEAFTRLKLS